MLCARILKLFSTFTIINITQVAKILEIHYRDASLMFLHLERATSIEKIYIRQRGYNTKVACRFRELR